MSTRTTSSNVSNSKTGGGHANDEHAKAQAAGSFAVKAPSGNAVEIWADGAVWDTVANKFLSTNDVVRNG